MSVGFLSWNDYHPEFHILVTFGLSNITLQTMLLTLILQIHARRLTSLQPAKSFGYV